MGGRTVTRDEILDNLHEQIADRESLIPKDEPNSIFAHDAQVLREVLHLLGDGAKESVATIKDFKVGQTVYILNWEQKKAIKEEVVKVGRKYVTVNKKWCIRFEETYKSGPYLIEKTEIGARMLLFPSEDAVHEYMEREELKKWMHMAADWGNIDRYTLAQLRAVKKILEGNYDSIRKGNQTADGAGEHPNHTV